MDIFWSIIMLGWGLWFLNSVKDLVDKHLNDDIDLNKLDKKYDITNIEVKDGKWNIKLKKKVRRK